MAAPGRPRRAWPKMDVLGLADWHALARQHPACWAWITERALHKELAALQAVELEVLGSASLRRLRELQRWNAARPGRHDASQADRGLDPQVAVEYLVRPVWEALDVVVPQATQHELLVPTSVLRAWRGRLAVAEALALSERLP